MRKQLLTLLIAILLGFQPTYSQSTEEIATTCKVLKDLISKSKENTQLNYAPVFYLAYSYINDYYSVPSNVKPFMVDIHNDNRRTIDQIKNHLIKVKSPSGKKKKEYYSRGPKFTPSGG